MTPVSGTAPDACADLPAPTHAFLGGTTGHMKEIIALLEEMHLPYHDYGTYTGDSCDYAVFAQRAAKAVVSGECERGILCCGTGIGMSLAANKIPGIRCALLSDCFSAEMCRAHNNANMCALGGRVTGPELAKRMVDLFLTTEFLGGRHADRVNMISALENHDR